MSNQSSSVNSKCFTTASNEAVSSTHLNGAKRGSGQISSRMSRDEFLIETSGEEQAALRVELGNAISHFVEQERPVYLEGLGIFIPDLREINRVDTLEHHLVMRSEKRSSMLFEKCAEVTSYHYDRFSDLVEMRELAQWIQPRMSQHLHWNREERELRRLIRGFVEFIKYEIIMRGISAQIPAVGTFYCLHNRQGDSFVSWFAGADIFLHSNWQRVARTSSGRYLERPVLRNAWEPLEAVCGKPVRIMEIDIARELSQLGYDGERFRQESKDQERYLKVAVFKRLAQSSGQKASFIYCTDGLRLAALNQKPSDKSLPENTYVSGSEVIFQLVAKNSDYEETDSEHSECGVPLWPSRPIIMAWILLQSARSHTLKQGAGISSNLPLSERSCPGIKTIMVTPFSTIKSEQLSAQGPFTYANVLGVTEDEAKLSQRSTAEHLLTLLEHRHLDQITFPDRSSVISRTILPSQYQSSAPVSLQKDREDDAKPENQEAIAS